MWGPLIWLNKYSHAANYMVYCAATGCGPDLKDWEVYRVLRRLHKKLFDRAPRAEDLEQLEQGITGIREAIPVSGNLPMPAVIIPCECNLVVACPTPACLRVVIL
jgi:hypothetical protein